MARAHGHSDPQGASNPVASVAGNPCIDLAVTPAAYCWGPESQSLGAKCRLGGVRTQRACSSRALMHAGQDTAVGLCPQTDLEAWQWKVRKDVIDCLKLKVEEPFRQSFDRPNIRYQVAPPLVCPLGPSGFIL